MVNEKRDREEKKKEKRKRSTRTKSVVFSLWRYMCKTASPSIQEISKDRPSDVPSRGHPDILVLGDTDWIG